MMTPSIKRVLVAIDFSEITDAVIAYGRYLARAFNAELKVLHVVHVPALAEASVWLTPSLSSGIEEDIRREIIKGVETKLAQISEMCGTDCRGVEALLREGNPYEQIIECAAELEADLIVVGTHSRAGIAHRIIGSVAERVVRRAHCSVFCLNPRVRETIEGKLADAD